MGALISYIHDIYEKFFYIRCRIGICGVSNAGKTSVFYILAKDEEKLKRLTPTIHPTYEETYYNSLAVKLYDVGGRYHSHRWLLDYVQQFQALIYVVDASDRAMFEDSKSEFAKFTEHPLTDRLAIVVLANKQDLNDALTPEEVAEGLELEKYQKTHKIHLIATSCREKDTVFEALQWLENNLN